VDDKKQPKLDVLAPYKGKDLNQKLFVKELKYIIVGTGRCGTVFTAKLLSSIGIPCTHEAIFSHDGLNNAILRLQGKRPIYTSTISKLCSVADEEKGTYWFDKQADNIVAESSYMAAPYLDCKYLRKTIVIHLIRNPLAVINSFIHLEYFTKAAETDEYHAKYHRFIYRQFPELRHYRNPIVKAALYYIKWNEMIRNKIKGRAHLLFPIEYGVERLFNFLGVNPQKYYNTKVNRTNPAVSKPVVQSFTDIPNTDIARKLEETYKNFYFVKI